jgi:hypothetical protein
MGSGATPRYEDVPVHFYELREGDDDVFSDILLVREEEIEPEEFFELVQGIRRRIVDTHEHDTLVEGIAEELERVHGFIAVTDDRLTASVNVSRNDDDNYLADLDDLPEEGVDYRAVLADFDPSGGRPN